jgi:putative acetyltransferase
MNLDLTIAAVREHSRQLVRELDILKNVYRETGYSFPQCHALLEIEKQPEINLSQLVEQLLLDKSTTSRIIKSLVEKGLVRVNTPAYDQRIKQYVLTGIGKKVVAKNNAIANQQVEEALMQLESYEQKRVIEGLQIYAKALGRSRRQSAYTIREIERDDNPAMARIIREVMTEFQCVGEGYSINDPEVDRMYEAYRKPRSKYYVISHQDQLLGGAGIGPLANGDPEVCELKKMYFYGNLRGLGLGRKLLSMLLNDAREFGYKGCYLETVSRMWQANMLYQKMGFKKLDVPMGNTGHGACEVFYAREL